jgi:ATP-binding cassette subfamily F protein 3
MTAAEGAPDAAANGRTASANGGGAGPAKAKPATAKATATAKAKASDASKNRLREQAKAERAVEDAEAALRALEEELAEPAAWATKYESGKSEARHTAARRAIDAAYARLEALVD